MPEYKRPLAPARVNDFLWLTLVAAITAGLCAPFIQAIYSLGLDEGVLIHGAERMLRGDTLYTDFFEFHPPGGFLLTASWFRILGISFLSARLLAVLTITGVSCFTYLACRHSSQNRPLSALLTIGWVVTSQGPWTQVNHSYFSTLFSMITVWAALNNVEDFSPRLRWPLIAGTTAGAAAMVTPTCGALTLLAAVIAFIGPTRRRVEWISYALAGGLVPAGLLVYLIWHHAFKAAFNDVILFPALHYASIQIVPFGAFTDGHNYPLLFLFPVAVLLTIVVSAWDWPTCLQDHRLRLCAALAIAGFAACFPRPDIAHITFVAPLALPLLACCMTRVTQFWHRAYRYAAGGILIGLCAPAAFSFLGIAEEARRGEIVSTPRGAVTFLNRTGPGRILIRLAALPARDGYFFYPYISLLPFLSAREHVSSFDIFMPHYTLASQYHDACLSALHQATWVVIARRQTDPKYMKQVYPAMEAKLPQETQQFEQALDSSFELAAQEDTYELRRRRDDASDRVCATIE